MNIIVAERAGFCFGVKRAVDIAFDMADKREKVYTLGPIIHNPQVVEKLGSRGVITADGPMQDMEAAIIRTHGVTLDMQETLQASGTEVIDATCPFVKKAQQYARQLHTERYQVIILGDKDHPEVRSIVSYAGPDSIVVAAGETPVGLKSRVGIVVQTTQSFGALKELLSIIVEKTKEFKVYNTICNSTSLRQKETAEIAKQVQAMFVVGGRNSANTTRLTDLCRSIGVRTYHIETSSEIEPEWLAGIQSIGLTAGASTPDWIIDEVLERIRRIDGDTGQ